MLKTARDKAPSISDFLKKSGAHREALLVDECCENPVIYYDNENRKTVLQPNFCNSRFCPVCGNRRREKTRSKIEKCIAHFGVDKFRFITITQVDKTYENLEAASARFRKSFTSLKRSKIWKQKVKGSFFKYEATYCATRKKWHYHVHILALGFYFPQKELLKAWRKRSPGALILDIKKIDQGSIHELTKYVTKLQKRGMIPLDELADHFHAHRMEDWTGALREFNKEEKEEHEKGNFQRIGSLNWFCIELIIYSYNPSKFEIAQYLVEHPSKIPISCEHWIDKLEAYVHENKERHSKEIRLSS